MHQKHLKMFPQNVILFVTYNALPKHQDAMDKGVHDVVVRP